MFKDITRDDVYRIETQRLWLRWPKLTDAPAIANALADRRIADMTSRIRHPYPEADAETFVFSTRKNNHDGTGLGLVITPKDKPNQVIGALSLSPDSAAASALVLGYWIRVDQWGHGFAREAATSMTQTGFMLSRADALHATVKPDNEASHRILARIGFHKTGQESRFMPARDREELVDCFRLAKSEWRDGRPWSVYGAAA